MRSSDAEILIESSFNVSVSCLVAIVVIPLLEQQYSCTLQYVRMLAKEFYFQYFISTHTCVSRLLYFYHRQNMAIHLCCTSLKHQAPLSCPVASVKVYKITMYYIYGVQACMLSLICNAYIQCQMGAVLKHYFLKSYLQHTYMCFDCVALYSYIIMHLEIDLFSLQCALKTTSLMLQSIRHILLCYVSWLHTHTCWKLQLEIAHKHALEQ